MKYLIKYIFLLVAVGVMTTPLFAKKGKKAKVTQIKKASNSKKKKNKNQLKKAAVVKIKKAKVDKVNLNNLLNETIVTVAPTKSDSIPEKVVTIYSAFKPQLKNVAKIGFNNATAFSDSSTVSLNYQVPSQNLSFQYRPIALIPRALNNEQPIKLDNMANVKIGMGNYQHHFANVNINLIDKNINKHTISLDNEASTGTEHHLQMYRDFGMQYLTNYAFQNKSKIEALFFYHNSVRYRYGGVPDSSAYPNLNFEQKLNHFGTQIGWFDLNRVHRKVYFKPVLAFEYAKVLENASSTWLSIKSPLYYQMKNNSRFNFNINYDLSVNHTSTSVQQNNSILKFDPSIELHKWNTQLLVGISPVWLNTSTYKIYPNLYFQKQLKDTNYLVKSGWNTNFINNHYGNIVISNPWIAPILDMKATTLEKKFIDLEISSSKRLNYTLGLALNDYRNLVLFNRIIEPEIFKHGLKYQALFEPRAITLEVNASMRYQFSERILIHNSFKYLQFNSIKENAKPWGVLPLEIKSNLTWVPNRKWSIDAGMHYWTGSTQLDQNNKVTNLKNTLVLQAGFNYKLSTNWTAWAKGDNLLDKPYERWGNYPSLGVQIIAGIIYSFK